MQKTVYQTNPDGYFVGIATADASPLVHVSGRVIPWNGKANTVEWLIPGGCVEATPPALPDGKSAKWNGSAWDIVDPPAEANPVPDLPTTPELPPEQPSEHPPTVPTRLYKSMVWVRATDEEADEIEVALKSTTARIRGLWNDSMYFEVTDPLFLMIREMFSKAFGVERTDQLLEPI